MEVREFDVDGEDSYSYDSERDNRMSSASPLTEDQDSEINMSLCLRAFKELEPATYLEMKSIFD